MNAATSKPTYRLKNLDSGAAGYRVIYGETRPIWEQTFASLRAAKAFAKKHEGFGDVIFSIEPVKAGAGGGTPRAAGAVR